MRDALGKSLERRLDLIAAPLVCGAVVSTWLAPAGTHLVGGDWCLAFPISDDVLALSIGDVCGHGVGAFDAMAAVRDVVEAALLDRRDPAEILLRANALACRRPFAAPVTGIAALLDIAAKTLTFASAGHPPPLMIGPAGQMFLTRAPADVPLGIDTHYVATTYVVPVPPDTLLVFYTDGVTEHERDPIRGEEDVRAAAVHAYSSPAGNAARTIAQRVLARASGPDDAAILTVRLGR